MNDQKSKTRALSFFCAWLLALALIIGLRGLLETRQVRAASILHVAPGNGLGAQTCNDWANACGLQAALDQAVAGNEIWVAAGIYTPTLGGGSYATFELKDGVAIYGGFAMTEDERQERDFAANLTILSGDMGGDDITANGVVTDTENVQGVNAKRVVTAGEAVSNTTVLDGFTITAGYGYGYTSGGGMGSSGSPTLQNLIFSGNHASIGGGLSLGGQNYPKLTNVTFIHNRAYNSGGGLHNAGGSPTLTHVTFIENEVGGGDGNGGGMAHFAVGSPVLQDVVFQGNRAITGGGMYNAGSCNPVLVNVVFYANFASDAGGGMNNRAESKPVMTNVTFNANIANTGSALTSLTGSSPTLNNSILWGNPVTMTNAEIVIDADSGLQINHSLVEGGCPAGATSCEFVLLADPQFVDAPDGDLRLLLTSPAIDVGDNNAAGLDGVATDLAGNPRIVDIPGVGLGGEVIDMGAYEAILQRVFLPSIVR